MTNSQQNNETPRLAALKNRDFLLIWCGYLLSNVGSQMQLVAVSWHIFDLLQGQIYTVEFFGSEIELSASAIGLGSVGLVRVVPIILFAMLGGILADTRDRRKLLIWIQIAAGIVAGLLAYFTLSEQITIPAIYLLTAAGAATTALEQPSRQSIVPNLVPREHLPNAVSLITLMGYISTVIGPALAGLLVAAFGVGFVYAINAISFGAVLISLLLMRHRGRPATAVSTISWDMLVEGLHFTFNTRIIRSTMLLDFFATFFASARLMLPIVAEEILQVGVQGYGILATAQSVGSIIAGSILSLRRTIHRQGVVLLISVAVYGLATMLFGISTLFILSYILFALTGAGDTVSTVIRGTLRQMLTPDHLRGRMVSVNMVFFMGGPQLGELEAGLVAAIWGAPVAIVSGGLATVLITAVIAWRYPSLRNYTKDSMLLAAD